MLSPPPELAPVGAMQQPLASQPNWVSILKAATRTLRATEWTTTSFSSRLRLEAAKQKRLKDSSAGLSKLLALEMPLAEHASIISKRPVLFQTLLRYTADPIEFRIGGQSKIDHIALL